ncbi:hypothetical protein PGB90_006208 [Kerria lacca]
MSYKLNTCRNEYEKDPKIKDEDIQEMKIWIQEISNMPDVTEYMLIQIYHVCDYNLEKAKKLTKKFYTFKATAEELFTGLDRKSENEYSFWDTNYSILLPSTTAEGYRVYYAGLKNYNSSKYNFEISITTAIKVITAIILEKGICPGYLIIFDMEGFGIFINHSRLNKEILNKIFRLEIRLSKIIEINIIMNKVEEIDPNDEI